MKAADNQHRKPNDLHLCSINLDNGMRFRSYDNLRLFDVVARHMSFTAAAEELNLTKGAVSYQVRKLEDELGFPVFLRRPGGIELTAKGRKLWHASQAAFLDLETEIARLRDDAPAHITIGMSTYFASRWLSPRLMRFTAAHPDISLRLQPMTDLVTPGPGQVDMTIRWGNGHWQDMEIEPLFLAPAFPTAGQVVAARIEQEGIENALPDIWLLRDRDDSTAWRDWRQAAGLKADPKQDSLVIEDPNVRVQTLIDGQGLALNDRLVAAELESGQLIRVSEVALESYGYFLAYRTGALGHGALKHFRDWIMEEARLEDTATAR